MSRIFAGRVALATTLGAALAMGCGSDVGAKTYTAPEGHDGSAHGQTAVPAEAKAPAASSKVYAGPTR
jgi:hypothetical protein